MKFKTVKSAKEVELENVECVLDIIDNSIKSIILRDRKGHAVQIIQEYSSLAISVKAPPEKKTVFCLTGKLNGLIDVYEKFEEDSDARKRLAEYQGKSTDENCGLEISEVEVEVQD